MPSLTSLALVVAASTMGKFSNSDRTHCRDAGCTSFDEKLWPMLTYTLVALAGLSL